MCGIWQKFFGQRGNPTAALLQVLYSFFLCFLWWIDIFVRQLLWFIIMNNQSNIQIRFYASTHKFVRRRRWIINVYYEVSQWIFLAVQVSRQRWDVAEYSGSLPAGLYSLWHQRISTQACQSPGRRTTWGARQILFCTKTLHQPHYKTEVSSGFFTKIVLTTFYSRMQKISTCCLTLFYAQVWEKSQSRYDVCRCVGKGEHREYSRIQLCQVCSAIIQCWV